MPSSSNEGAVKPGADPDTGPLAALGLVHGGNRDLRASLVGESPDRVDDLIRPVLVDQLHDGLQVLARLVVLDVVLHLCPRGVQEQFGMAGAPACPRFEGPRGHPAHRVAANGHGDWYVTFEERQHLEHRVGVATTQHHLWVGYLAYPGLKRPAAGQPKVRSGMSQPSVRHIGYV